MQRATVWRYAQKLGVVKQPRRRGHPSIRENVVRILLTGSRDWRFPATIAEAILEAAADFGAPLNAVTIVHGDCPSGADRIARLFVESHPDLKQERHPADWKGLGKRAGYVRNVHMVSLGADVCLAFIRNNSPGARMCVRLARGQNIPRRVYVDETRGRLAIPSPRLF